MSRRVVITGIGLVSPLGVTTEQSWKRACAGESGLTSLADRIDNFEHYPVKAAGLVTGETELINHELSLKEQKKTDRFIHLGLCAAREALEQARFSELSGATREQTGVFMGVGIGGLDAIAQGAYRLEQRGTRGISPYLIPKVINNELACAISIAHQTGGPLSTMTNACSSSADAIGHAFFAIREGRAPCMIAGGAEAAICPLSISGFGNMRALSTWDGNPQEASRPFSLDRSGFVMGEGAAVLVLEERDHARSRGADIIAEIVGYGATADAYHPTAIHPDGSGCVRAINAALTQAGITPDRVGYCNAHGTGTRMNDQIETEIIKKVYGSHAHTLLVSSTKSMTGHLLGGSGALEAAFTACALRDQVVPPTINQGAFDPLCDLNYVPNHSVEHSFEYALSHSFGFGGGNAVLALRAHY